MDPGIVHSAAALDLLTKIQDARAQNLANASTIGYRKRIASADAFASSLRAAAGLTLPDYRQDIDHSPGDLRETGQPHDLAIEGPGFFALETNAGVRYTRNGNFQLDAEGFLVAADGARVLGEVGPIQADPGRGPLNIDPTGKATQDGEELARLRIVEFKNLPRLVPDDAGRFSEGPQAEPFDSVDAKVRQGYLENANVNVVDELVQMISGFRAFEAAQKALIGIDRIRGEAVGIRQ